MSHIFWQRWQYETEFYKNDNKINRTSNGQRADSSVKNIEAH